MKRDGAMLNDTRMSIILTSEQRAWFEARVAFGGYASVEDAVRQLIDERIAEQTSIESDDLAWAKPYLDEAVSEIAAGRIMTLEEHLAQIAAADSKKSDAI